MRHQSQIEWCRGQQLAALTHIRPVVVAVGHGAALIPHRCSHPQCCPSNNRQWLSDAFAEELMLAYPEHFGSAAEREKFAEQAE
jgi:hypothetical protein